MAPSAGHLPFLTPLQPHHMKCFSPRHLLQFELLPLTWIPLFIIILPYFHFKYVHVPICLYEHRICEGAYRNQKKVAEPLEQEFVSGVTGVCKWHDVGAGS